MSQLIKKIYYHDTDCGGVVYYANYLRYMEEARTEYMLERGIDLKALGEKGIMFVVKNVSIDYKAPARYADTLTISSSITKIKNVSLEFTQEIKRAGKLLVSAQTVLVCINSDFTPCQIPPELQKVIQA
ncbi:MAG: YbgC/FadM family acyl-CoA thioesterase [Candidatus Omnitrophica bacterium]|nr:YbgC/FadM family acyl-CoA thioesterase [Candidatus Omnitrophota bacterium]